MKLMREQKSHAKTLRRKEKKELGVGQGFCPAAAIGVNLRGERKIVLSLPRRGNRTQPGVLTPGLGIIK
jgi:hypothetical protein